MSGEAPVRADLPAPTRMLDGPRVLRVVWQLHTDVLVGHCWCGVSREAIDPIELWDWLHDHAEHDGDDVPAGVPQPHRPAVAR